MNIHEYQAKELLAKHGVAIPIGKIAFSAKEAVANYRSLANKKCLVKAQVHSGARGKAGGIIVCENNNEVAKATADLIGSNLVTHQTGAQGKAIEKVYIEEMNEIERETYMAFVIDRASERVAAVVSTEGGMEIEEVAAKNPDAIIRMQIDPTIGLANFQARELAFNLDLPNETIKQAVITFMGCYNTLITLDASMIEINPLAVTRDKKLIALDAKIDFDDNALEHHPEIRTLRDKSQEDPRETRASEHDLNYVGLDGNIGCMINGAGLAMATMDMIKHAGGEPANFLDIGGGASPERVAKAFELVLDDSNVKALLVNIYAGINRCDWIAQGIIKAFETVEIKVPLIVRLSGTNVEIGKKILKESKCPIISADILTEAAQRAVEEANK